MKKYYAPYTRQKRLESENYIRTRMREELEELRMMLLDPPRLDEFNNRYDGSRRGVLRCFANCLFYEKLELSEEEVFALMETVAKELGV
jgi:hypothetical protein